ncbi:hypothetical protein I7I53_11907 [Histoplasma capsulatum var. duboisii H88]|uniref:Uncharacterized protein n=1 Tax=Ajellomyces capsulatus (strain H88) TaxID=544711 RepID=A0A8A1LV54_AJEC8|nr:hypothetical protein I7I53_11907 [Histoplasma capsulatum var. duboisii H88]
MKTGTGGKTMECGGPVCFALPTFPRRLQNLYWINQRTTFRLRPVLYSILTGPCSCQLRYESRGAESTPPSAVPRYSPRDQAPCYISLNQPHIFPDFQHALHPYSRRF